jgi:hypothetical protein
MTALERLAIEHLLLRLRPLNRALRAAVARQAAEAAQLDRPDLVPYCITDEQVGRLLDRVGSWAVERMGDAAPAPLTGPERAAEQELRDRAAAGGFTLPLDQMADLLELSPTEQESLLLCVTPELDRAYERIFAYLLDDLNRRHACAELLLILTDSPGEDWLARRSIFSRVGRLRRLGLIRARGDAPTELRQEFAPVPRLMDYLLGSGGDLTVLAHDPGAIAVPARFSVPAHVDARRLDLLGRAIRCGQLDLVGVWGAVRAGQHDVVVAIAQAAGLPLRRVPSMDLAKESAELAIAVGEALDMAATLRTLLWIPIEQLADDDRQVLQELLTRSRTPACLSGAYPWRPTRAMSSRTWAEIEVSEPGYRDRKAMWSAALPALNDRDAELLGDLAARYRMSSDELRAVATVARTDGLIGGNGKRQSGGTLASWVEGAAATVAHRPTDGFARAIRPRRGPNDLVLPQEHHQMVLEIAAAFRDWPRVAEMWGFAHHANGGAGVKALFTGEPGTGKTLAAEVIAGMLDLTMLKVDVSRVVSKWVGETEKNLEAAFQQAEDGHAVLFFDEADALFGKRGEIKHGVDRYANLEVGFLLQRLEQSDGLVILASNRKENIDAAFTSRFHYIVHFPRPGIQERRRIWRIAFPSETPLACDVDLDALAELDMTGASIAGAARSAALLAAQAADREITNGHVVCGVSRQYQRDARLLRPEDLGPYAAFLQGERQHHGAGGQGGETHAG